MRIHIRTTPNNSLVPFDYQKNLVGAIYKWLGNNEEIHDSLSLFSFSWLKEASSNEKGLNFKNGTSWFFSSFDKEILKNMIRGINERPEIAFGMSVSEITIEKDKAFTENEHRFLLGSPILIKRSVDEKKLKHFTYQDDDSAALMKETLLRKMNKAGIIDNSLEIFFDRNYLKAKTKLVNYKGINNRANFCPVIIKGMPETLTFAWNVGIGNSTGIGFGSLI